MGTGRSIKCNGFKLFVAFGLLGCAVTPANRLAKPAMFETAFTVGIIESKVTMQQGKYGETRTTVPLFVGGMIVPIEVPGHGSDWFAYSIRSSNGTVLVTRSQFDLDEKDCAKLWHAPLSQKVDARYNFVAGTLHSSNECADEISSPE